MTAENPGELDLDSSELDKMVPVTGERLISASPHPASVETPKPVSKEHLANLRDSAIRLFFDDVRNFVTNELKAASQNGEKYGFEEAGGNCLNQLFEKLLRMDLPNLYDDAETGNDFLDQVDSVFFRELDKQRGESPGIARIAELLIGKRTKSKDLLKTRLDAIAPRKISTSRDLLEETIEEMINNRVTFKPRIATDIASFVYTALIQRLGEVFTEPEDKAKLNQLAQILRPVTTSEQLMNACIDFQPKKYAERALLCAHMTLRDLSARLNEKQASDSDKEIIDPALLKTIIDPALLITILDGWSRYREYLLILFREEIKFQQGTSLLQIDSGATGIQAFLDELKPDNNGGEPEVQFGGQRSDSAATLRDFPAPLAKADEGEGAKDNDVTSDTLAVVPAAILDTSYFFTAESGGPRSAVATDDAEDMRSGSWGKIHAVILDQPVRDNDKVLAASGSAAMVDPDSAVTSLQALIAQAKAEQATRGADAQFGSTETDGGFVVAVPPSEGSKPVSNPVALAEVIEAHIPPPPAVSDDNGVGNVDAAGKKKTGLDQVQPKVDKSQEAAFAPNISAPIQPAAVAAPAVPKPVSVSTLSAVMPTSVPRPRRPVRRWPQVLRNLGYTAAAVLGLGAAGESVSIVAKHLSSKSSSAAANQSEVAVTASAPMQASIEVKGVAAGIKNAEVADAKASAENVEKLKKEFKINTGSDKFQHYVNIFKKEKLPKYVDALYAAAENARVTFPVDVSEEQKTEILFRAFVAFEGDAQTPVGVKKFFTNLRNHLALCPQGTSPEEFFKTDPGRFKQVALAFKYIRGFVEAEPIGDGVYQLDLDARTNPGINGFERLKKFAPGDYQLFKRILAEINEKQLLQTNSSASIVKLVFKLARDSEEAKSKKGEKAILLKHIDDLRKVAENNPTWQGNLIGQALKPVKVPAKPEKVEPSSPQPNGAPPVMEQKSDEFSQHKTGFLGLEKPQIGYSEKITALRPTIRLRGDAVTARTEAIRQAVAAKIS